MENKVDANVAACSPKPVTGLPSPVDVVVPVNALTVKSYYVNTVPNKELYSLLGIRFVCVLSDCKSYYVYEKELAKVVDELKLYSK